MSGTLFVIGTPIGCVKDLTIRASEVLRSLKIIACEDTRDMVRLLKEVNEIKVSGVLSTGSVEIDLEASHHIDIGHRYELISFYEHNERKKLASIIERLKRGEDIGLCSSRGMPSISDPGYILIREAIRENMAVQVIPGVSSVLTALVISGLPPDKFLFLGFPPKTEIKQRNFFERYKNLDVTLIFFESAHRLHKTFNNLESLFSGWNVAICRELTKSHEEVIRGTYTEAIEHLSQQEILGEVTVVLSLKK